MRYSYKLKFLYREAKEGEQKTEYLFIESKEKDPVNAGEIEMLRYLTKHNYYSGKLVLCEKI